MNEYSGCDPRWTGMQRPDNAQTDQGKKSLVYYHANAITTNNGSLNITTTSDLTHWKGLNPFTNKQVTFQKEVSQSSFLDARDPLNLRSGSVNGSSNQEWPPRGTSFASLEASSKPASNSRAPTTRLGCGRLSGSLAILDVPCMTQVTILCGRGITTLATKTSRSLPNILMRATNRLHIGLTSSSLA